MKLTSFALTLALTFSSSVAAAQTLELFGRDTSIDRNESPQNFAIELRFAPWQPAIDSEPGLVGTPFLDYFGEVSDGQRRVSDRLLASLAFDWQVLRINYVGSLGLGVSLGYSSFSANAPLTMGGGKSGQESSLSVLPGYAVGVLRVDVLARRTVVPLVLYGKVGVAATYWWITSGENLARRSEASPPAMIDNTADFGRAATGMSYGWQLAAGLMLRLDFLEPRAQRAWDLEMGVNHSYLFAEFMSVRDWDRPQLRLGSNTWVFGLAFEF